MNRISIAHDARRVKANPMANSFGDQFLKAGLVTRARLDQAQKSKSKRQKLKHKQKIEVIDEAAVAARQAAAEKTAHDRELNRRQNEEAGRKAAQAQLRQLVELNRLSRDDGEVSYHFQDGTAIRTIHVSAEVHDRLVRGLLAIVRLDDRYEVIPSTVAEKITLREAFCLVGNTATPPGIGEDDAYADYQVPDDLMW
jgi:uncharacterized protein